MEIVKEDISSYIIDSVKLYPTALAVVRDVCRARPSGYKFMPRYRAGRWDGYISLMHSMTRFPTGLLNHVCYWLEKRNFSVDIVDTTKTLEFQYPKEDDLNGIMLRDYQLQAVSMLLEAKRGIAKMATNSGKTEVMASIIKSLNMPKTLVVVHRKELMYQTAERFNTRLGIDVGLVGDGNHKFGVVTVAMIQTLHNMLKKLKLECSLVMIDECHTASSDTMLDVLKVVPGSYRFGFSGTPLKYSDLPDMKLMGATGEVIVDISNDYLITSGYSAKPVINIHVIEDKDDTNWDMDYHSAYTQLIVHNDKRNKLISNIAKQSVGVTLLLVNQIEHGKLLEELIPNSVFVHGSEDMTVRRSVLEMMRGSDARVYIASPIFDEGIDVPSIDTLILAAGGKSNIKVLQRVGRGLRVKENGGGLCVHDFIDDTNKYLLEHSDARVATYEKEKFKIILA